MILKEAMFDVNLKAKKIKFVNPVLKNCEFEVRAPAQLKSAELIFIGDNPRMSFLEMLNEEIILNN